MASEFEEGMRLGIEILVAELVLFAAATIAAIIPQPIPLVLFSILNFVQNFVIGLVKSGEYLFGFFVGASLITPAVSGLAGTTLNSVVVGVVIQIIATILGISLRVATQQGQRYPEW